jgi:hypothetical protein
MNHWDEFRERERMRLESARQEIADQEERIAELEKALKPFADMHRPGTDPKELACSRGVASDMTILTSGDFERAASALKNSSLMDRTT